MIGVTLPLFPERASTLAGKVDALFFFMLGVSAFFSILIFLLVAYFAVRYRRKSEDERPAEIEGSLTLELVWTLIPLAIVIVMFVWGTRLYLEAVRPPANAVPVYVVGKQWMWKVQHAEGKSEINELHVPLGQPIRLLMTSEDVIHDFSIPAFRVKRDVLPGRYTSYWFEASRTGEYHLFCAQYCGTNHSMMTGKVVVMEPAAFQDWLSGNPSGEPMWKTGERLFTRFNCNTCHREGGRGPLLNGVFGKTIQLASGQRLVADEAYLRESIVNPAAKIVEGYQPVMPSFQGQMSETQVLQLIAYLKTLSGQKGAPAP